MKPNLDELEQLAVKATPGPWGAVVSDKYNFTVAILPPDFPQTPLVGRIRDEQDAAYITAACNSLPELINENRELRKRMRELERQTVVLASHLSKHVLHTMSTKEWLEWSESVAKETKC